MTDVVEINHCEGCGICCEAFMLVEPHIWRGERLNDERLLKWLDEDIISLEVEGVIALGHVDKSDILYTVDLPGHWFYTCKLYNKELKQCTEHEDRPFICRDFPSNLEDGEPFIKGCAMANQLYSENGNKNP